MEKRDIQMTEKQEAYFDLVVASEKSLRPEVIAAAKAVVTKMDCIDVAMCITEHSTPIVDRAIDPATGKAKATVTGIAFYLSGWDWQRRHGFRDSVERKTFQILAPYFVEREDDAGDIAVRLEREKAVVAKEPSQRARANRMAFYEMLLAAWKEKEEAA